MLTKNINFINFRIKKKSKLITKKLKSIFKENNQVIKSLSNKYKNSYNINNLKFFKKELDFRIIGMGGSILGANAIYDFLKKNIKKKFYFIDNLQSNFNHDLRKNYNNLIISKSGNTIETIINANILIKNKEKNIFIEVSGGVTLKNISKFNLKGVHGISIGALTHQSTNVDIGLDLHS